MKLTFTCLEKVNYGNWCSQEKKEGNWISTKLKMMTALSGQEIGILNGNIHVNFSGHKDRNRYSIINGEYIAHGQQLRCNDSEYWNINMTVFNTLLLREGKLKGKWSNQGFFFEKREKTVFSSNWHVKSNHVRHSHNYECQRDNFSYEFCSEKVQGT